ncbi:hypothetical protein VC83_08620 [Pseudogymnoascus destructans]|uniref:Uncharacterized protein n=2 Tax=Pseudogymnoascus destructans TaxID=655981 RepID=L8FS79_PSED2|nr:uncharacterized protein VC83_08620 [Pseudogymnoascus destructans]ELR03333.1 hypothetical protein GMDG_06080 [Pseudogymnoascus destructans 20631-21]OAF54821.1 hypothetical protein VC83_08620 [Pseudogymnoascus destructans]
MESLSRGSYSISSGARLFIFNICYLNVCVQEVLCSIEIVGESCTFFAASLLPLSLPLLSYITPFLPSVALSPTTTFLLCTFLHNNKLYIASPCFLFFLNFIPSPPNPLPPKFKLVDTPFIQTCWMLKIEPLSMSATESSRSSGQILKELRYSRENLLFLRDQLPVIICDVTRMNNASADLLRLPSQIMSDPGLKSCPTRVLRRVPNFKNRDDVGGSGNSRLHRHKISLESDEEEIVYRGHPIRHSLKETQWQFKRRDDSDRSSQPLSAPPGYHAQKAENFQKFYRAVVSPTHVRVTAGGRIVPNIRAPPQPVFVWNRDKLFFEAKQDKKAPGIGDANWQEGAALRPSDPNQLPINNPTTNANIATAPPSHSLEKLLNPGTVQPSTITEPQVLAPVPTLPNVSDQNNSAGPHPIKLSPPGQFDMTKPFMVNGQMVYPLPSDFQIPHGVPVIPFNMLGNTIPLQNLQPSQYPQMPLHHGLFNPTEPSLGQAQPIPYNNPLTTPPIVQNLPQIGFGGIPPIIPHSKVGDRSGSNNRLVAMPPLPGLDHPPYNQPGYVKQKIKSLQDEIKKFDHQLDHNKHQIDEIHVKKQRFYVESQIQTLEASLALLPSEDFNHSFPGAHPRPLAPPIPSWVATPVYHPRSFDGVYDQGPLHQPASSRVINRSEPFHNPAPVPAYKASVAKSAQPSRTRLSLSAAKAAPFKPRSQQGSQPASVVQQPVVQPHTAPCEVGETNSIILGETTSTPAEHGQDIESRLKGTGNAWAGPKGADNHPMSSSNTTLVENPEALETQNYKGRHLMLPGQPQDNGSTPVLADTRGLGSASHHTPMPYLMGFPPPGVPWKEARSHELMYTRPLTPEEVRARHLYWGNASKEFLKGLPKFDGQDFYPPSPQKGPALPVGQGRHSEASTIIRKSKDSSATSKEQGLGEESQALVLRTEAVVGGRTSPDKNVALHDDNDDVVSVDSWGASKSVCSPPQHGSKVVAKFNKPYSATTSAFLLGMLKNSPAVSSPLSGLSSTHAVGCLPNYGGTAILSLAPGPRQRSSFTFDAPTAKVVRSASGLSVRHENRPPSRAGSASVGGYTAAEFLAKVNRQNEERQGNAEQDWKTAANGVGSVANSSW